MTGPQRYFYEAVVTGVYDGDTITVDLDLGLHVVVHGVKIRLYGINAPELRGGTEASKAEGRRSRDWLREQILGKSIGIRTYKDKTGKYGRYLGRIWHNGDWLNDELVRLGLAERKEY